MQFVRRGTNSVKWDSRDESILPLWVADMDLPVSSEITDAMRRRLDHPYFGYTEVPGEFYNNFIDWAKQRQSWTCHQNWMTFSPAVMTSLRTAIATFTQPGEGILVPSPVYFPFFSSVKDAGRNLLTTSLQWSPGEKRYVLDFKDLETQLAGGQVSMLLFCNPHNPVGRVWTGQEMDRLVLLCKRYEVFLVCDEIHADVVYEEHKFTPVAPLLEKHGVRGIALHSPGKTFSIPGLATSIAISPDTDVMSQMKTALSPQGGDLPNILALEAAMAAYGSSGDWYEQTMKVLQANRNRVHEWVAENLPESPFSSALLPEGTYLYWIDLRHILQARGLSAGAAQHSLMKDGGLWLSPGHVFGTEGEGFFRLNFACPQEILEEGLSRLYEWTKKTAG